MTGPEKAYYQKRAPEYDDWYLGTGLYAARSRPGWHEEVDALRSLFRSLGFSSYLDVACGTAFMTQHLPGRVTGIDQSPAMLGIARERLRSGSVLQGDAFRLPFRSGSFDCLITGHYYGHLVEADRARFLAEARRVAGRLLIFDAALHDGVQPEEEQRRELKDGSSHSVYKRYFTPEGLAAELGGGRTLHAGHWFVAALA
jgi:ubiquinone/menaquinone biosynthesis C-methylase UbiE